MPIKCIKLAESVLDNSCLDFRGYDDGPDNWECSMCGRQTEAEYDPPGKMKRVSMNNLAHEEDCPYVLAKELLSGI